MEYLKLTTVEIAKEELESLGNIPTPSKISVMTGMQRKDVTRLINDGPNNNSEGDLISRIIGLWQSGKRFKNNAGRTKVLDFSGREGEFAKLVASVSTDLNPYTVAFELERAGFVKQTKSGLKLIKHGYEPCGNIEESLRLLAEDSEELYSGVLENIFTPKYFKNLHVKTSFDNIPASKAEEVRQWFLHNGGKFHQEAQSFLSNLDRDLNPEVAIQYPLETSIKASICTFSCLE